MSKTREQFIIELNQAQDAFNRALLEGPRYNLRCDLSINNVAAAKNDTRTCVGVVVYDTEPVSKRDGVP